MNLCINWRHSQFTKTKALALSGADTPLLAEHMYTPTSFLVTFWIFSVCLFEDAAMETPSLDQDTVGKGCPVALQNRDKTSVSLTVLFWGLVTIWGGTGSQRKKALILWWVQSTTRGLTYILLAEQCGNNRVMAFVALKIEIGGKTFGLHSFHNPFGV